MKSMNTECTASAVFTSLDASNVEEYIFGSVSLPETTQREEPEFVDPTCRPLHLAASDAWKPDSKTTFPPPEEELLSHSEESPTWSSLEAGEASPTESFLNDVRNFVRTLRKQPRSYNVYVPDRGVVGIQCDRSFWPLNVWDLKDVHNSEMNSYFELVCQKVRLGTLRSDVDASTFVRFAFSCSKEGEEFRLFLRDDVRSVFYGKVTVVR